MPTSAAIEGYTPTFAQILIHEACALYSNQPPPRGHRRRGVCLRFRHHRPVPLALSMGAIPRAKAAVKLHTLIDLRGNVPTFLRGAGPR